MLRKDSAPDLRCWLRVAEPVNADHFVIFKGLAEQMQLELLLGLQARTDAGVRTRVTALRPVVAVVRRTEATSLADLDESLIKQTRLDASVLGRYLVTAVQRATTTPDEERRKDVWDLAVLGLSRQLDFTPISQAWLRETAKRWAEEELPQHRGRQAAKTSMDTVSVVGQLSACLRETRPDHGVDPAALSRRDIIAFTNRLAHRERTGTISVKMRVRACRDARRFLTDIRAMGLTRPGGVADGFPTTSSWAARTSPPSRTPTSRAGTCPPGCFRSSTPTCTSWKNAAAPTCAE